MIVNRTAYSNGGHSIINFVYRLIMFSSERMNKDVGPFFGPWSRGGPILSAEWYAKSSGIRRVFGSWPKAASFAAANLRFDWIRRLVYDVHIQFYVWAQLTINLNKFLCWKIYASRFFGDMKRQFDDWKIAEIDHNREFIMSEVHFDIIICNVEEISFQTW